MHIHELFYECECVEVTDEEQLDERVIRQFKRYGNVTKRQFRCTSGPKKGRLVTSPDKCGKRKDPKRVLQGKRASRIKKGQRIRRTQFTKRKPASKKVQRWNKLLSGRFNIK